MAPSFFPPAPEGNVHFFAPSIFIVWNHFLQWCHCNQAGHGICCVTATHGAPWRHRHFCPGKFSRMEPKVMELWLQMMFRISSGWFFFKSSRSFAGDVSVDCWSKRRHPVIPSYLSHYEWKRRGWKRSWISWTKLKNNQYSDLGRLTLENLWPRHSLAFFFSAKKMLQEVKDVLLWKPVQRKQKSPLVLHLSLHIIFSSKGPGKDVCPWSGKPCFFIISYNNETKYNTHENQWYW